MTTEMDHEVLMRIAYKRFGEPYSINFFGNSWRVWWTTWHVHYQSSTSDLASYADTLQEALNKALNIDKLPDTVLIKGHCGEHCPEYKRRGFSRFD